MSEYEETKLWRLLAFERAIRDLPEIPPVGALWCLASVASFDYWEVGKRLQFEHGSEAIPPKTELECAAGLWTAMRNGILQMDADLAAAKEETQ